MGLLERLGLSSQVPESEEERRVAKVKILEAEAFAAKERPIEAPVTLPCGHRSQRPHRPGIPTPPRGFCPLCNREHDELRAGGRAPFVPADEEILIDAVHGRIDSRRERRQPRGWAEKTARWEAERRERGEVLSNSEQELAALRRIQELRAEEEEQERLNALSPEERAALAASNWRRKHGVRGGVLSRYEPSPAKARG